MTGSALEASLRRDRSVVGAALAALVALAWSYLLWLGHDMGMNAGAAVAPAYQPWDATRFAFMFVMWAVMMVGMMMPSAAPMILLYTRVGRLAERHGKPLAATGFFAGGYLLAWTVFSLAATFGQWGLEYVLLLSPMMVSTSGIFSALVLISAGIYQWSPLKDACLEHCQSPLVFIQRHGGFQRHPAGSLSIGFQHGIYCIGCCWALMTLLFVGGVMNFLWAAGIAAFVLLEKVLPGVHWLPRFAGAALVAAGTWLLSTAVA